MAEYKNMLEKRVKLIELDEQEQAVNLELNIARVKHDTRAVRELERQKDSISMQRDLINNIYK